MSKYTVIPAEVNPVSTLYVRPEDTGVSIAQIDQYVLVTHSQLPALISALQAALPDGGWLPIESAPKDGEEVLLWGGRLSYEDDYTGTTYPIKKPVAGSLVDGKWRVGQGDGHDNYVVLLNPTHFRPFPHLPPLTGGGKNERAS